MAAGYTTVGGPTSELDTTSGLGSNSAYGELDAAEVARRAAQKSVEEQMRGITDEQLQQNTNG